MNTSNNSSIIVLMLCLLLFFRDTVLAEPINLLSSVSDRIQEAHHLLGNDSKTMDVASYDMDQDGDIDIILAVEFGRNILLINDGKGGFDQPFLFTHIRDSEDIGVADFDGDGDLDIIFVSEDDKNNELYFNDGDGGFDDKSHLLPVTGISNSVVVMDINNDHHVDILIGNNGQNKILLNKGDGFFIDATRERIKSAENDATQDLHLADIDNDGDADLLVANEGQNKIYINNGTGFFSDETAERLPWLADESREVITGDVDADGDLDLYFANVQFLMNAFPQDRLLINNGKGVFVDGSADRLPRSEQSHFTASFIDLEEDGDLDILTGSSIIYGPNAGVLLAYINDGSGHFYLDNMDAAGERVMAGNVFDINLADYDGDNIADIYIANRASQEGNGGKDYIIFRARKLLTTN